MTVVAKNERKLICKIQSDGIKNTDDTGKKISGFDHDFIEILTAMAALVSEKSF